MPKTPSIILREKLYSKGYELLDIYHLKDKDIIRLKNRITNKVYLYESKKHVRDLISDKDIDKLVNNILETIKE